MVGLLGFIPADEPARLYLVGMTRERWTPAETIEQFEFKQQHPVWCRAAEILVEKQADGKQVLSQCAPTVPGMVEVQPAGKGNKEQRLRAVTPYLRAGNVILPAEAEWLQIFLDEVCTFPQAPNDDIVDALSQLLDHLWQATMITKHICARSRGVAQTHGRIGCNVSTGKASGLSSSQRNHAPWHEPGPIQSGAREHLASPHGAKRGWMRSGHHA